MHLGAGVILANLKFSKQEVYINHKVATGLIKIGAFVGDHTEVGCNSVLNPGTVIGKNSIIFPLSCVSGIVLANTIVDSHSTLK